MRRRITTAVLAVAALVLGVAGCGDSGGPGLASAGGGTAAPSPTASKDPHQQALAFSQCMRDNGVPDFPDPDPNATGGLGSAMGEIDRDAPAFEKAVKECADELPNDGTPPPLNPEQQKQVEAWARCMREQGVDIPDPDPGTGRVDPQALDFDSPAFQAAQQNCEPLNQRFGSSGGTK